jgi:hypothetical protein
MAHANPMRTLDPGSPGSGVLPRQSPGTLIATLVPIGAFGFAWMASRSHRNIAAWVTAAVVGTTAVICGSIVAIKASEARP